jgi:hypothetical protein
MHFSRVLSEKYLTEHINLEQIDLLGQSTKNGQSTFTIRSRLVPDSLVCAEKKCFSHQQVALVTAVQD